MLFGRALEAASLGLLGLGRLVASASKVFAGSLPKRFSIHGCAAGGTAQ